jgi:hypothetical protein
MLNSRGPLRVLVISLAACSCLIVQPAGATTPSATSLLSSALHNAISGGAVHEVVVTKHAGETLTEVNDIGTFEGRQVVKLSDGSSVELLAFDSLKMAYIRGNKIGLKNYTGFPESAAVKYAGKWMVAVPSDQAYANITGSTTLKSDFDIDLRILDPVLSAKLVTINGVRAYEISGKQAASSNGPAASVKLFVIDAKTVLPLRLSETAKGATATVNWTKWGETIVMNGPSNAVPLP